MKRIFLSCITMLFLYFVATAHHISDSIDVAHYNIHLTEINTAEKTIQGHCQLYITPVGEALRGIALELQDLVVDSIVHNGVLISYIHENSLITFPLNAALQHGDTMSFLVYYHGQPFSEAWGGFHFSGEYAFNLGVGFQSIPHNLGKTWYPCVDDFTDRATYDFYITTDAPKKAICNGLKIAEHSQGGFNHVHWRISDPIPTYLASVAVGEYELYEDIYEGIENNIPIQIWARPQEFQNVAGSFVNLKNILAILEDCWGEYPFEKVGYVSTATGAMEHAGNIAYPHGMIDGTTKYEWLYTHELSHMWFGDKVNCAVAEEMWINEGWARYNEWLYREMLYPREEWLKEYKTILKKSLQYIHTPQGDNEYYALNQVPLEITYGKTTYDKGALVVHTLRHYMGDDKFFPAIKKYINTFGYGKVSSTEMMNFLSQTSGMDLIPFFQNWVFTPGFPNFSIDSLVSERGGHSLFVSQKGKGRTQLFDHNIVEVFFMSDQWEVCQDTMMVSGKQSHKRFDLPFTPSLTVIDYFDKISDASTHDTFLVNNTGALTGANTFVNFEVTSIQDSSLLMVTHHWVGPDYDQLPDSVIEISDYRSWLISGLHLERMSASAKFLYSKSAYLDNTLLTDASYEPVLLFREDRSRAWRKIPFKKIGSATMGYLKIDSVSPGEYVIGIQEKTILVEEVDIEKDDLLIYPNPASHSVSIFWGDMPADMLQITSNHGKILLRKPIKSLEYEYVWDCNGVSENIYFITVLKNNRISSTKKVVITH